MVSFRDFVNAFRELKLDRGRPVVVHASLSSIGEIRGGAETVLGALLSASVRVMAPAFTYKTMVTPEAGPPENAIEYGSGKDRNRMAEFFLPEMPVDPLMGVLSETIRQHSEAKRSNHPILSFTGIHVDSALQAQSYEEPLAPYRVLAEQDGLVLLIGVDHTVNTAIHYAERLAGRKQFVRWALTPQGVRECPNFPGCSDGFEQAAPMLEPFTRNAVVGRAVLRCIPLLPLIQHVNDLLDQDPCALLCSTGDERCETVRRSVTQQSRTPGDIESAP